MQIFIITSDHDDIPLAEIRTDGKKMDWISDNTNGHLPRISQGDFERLQQVVFKSSHMKLTHPEDSTVGMLRYLLMNGDVVEITSDGHSAKLNGELLEGDEKNALMGLIATGRLQVKQKADISNPTPIRQAPRPKVQTQPVGPTGFHKNMGQYRKDQKKKDENKKQRNSRHYDHEIENTDFSADGDEAFAKRLFYILKYGENEGGSDA